MPTRRIADSLRTLLAFAALGLTLGANPARLWATAGSGAKPAGVRAVAVSPGGAPGLRTADTCPTFSWGVAFEAERHELVVYVLDEAGGEAEPVLLEAFSGSVSSWTPPLGRCLERGKQYAWSVRGITASRASEWSQPNLFEVAGSTSMELEEALETIRQYAAGRGRIEDATPPSPLEAGSKAISMEAGPLAPAATELSVDGNVDAVSFSGSGSLLTDLRPDPLCVSSTRRFADCGNGTVTDGATGLVYLKNANCFPGGWTFPAANALAALMKDGVCGLTDGSHLGDWRLPTSEEWSTVLDSSCSSYPEIVGNGAPLTGCYADNAGANEWATDPLGGAYWSSTATSNTVASSANFNNGTLEEFYLKTAPFSFWPVRAGR